MSMIKKIINHQEVYESHGMEVPPYRMTYQEHIDLVEECSDKFHPLPKVKNTRERYGFIGMYYGVMIEIVALIS